MNMPGLYADLGADQDERSSLHGVDGFLKGLAGRLGSILGKAWQDTPGRRSDSPGKIFSKN
jgi:hypothetical protein